MIQDEKDQLLALFDDERRWCRGVEATDQHGEAVHYDDGHAVSWDLVGGLCHLFGWKRACKLFEPVSRYVARRRHQCWPAQQLAMAAMSTLLDFNDDDSTTHETVMIRLRELPVYHGKRLSI
jgi:hypothetical protein